MCNDGGLALWTALNEALSQGEEKLKWRICFLHTCVHTGGLFIDSLRMMNARHDITEFQIEEGCKLELEHFPWNSCKFAATAVAYMVADWTVCDLERIRGTVAPISQTMPIPVTTHVATTHNISEAFHKACEAAETSGSSTALHVKVEDVELERRQERCPFKAFANTFAHAFVMTVSPAGVFLYQAYGPRGYTLRNHIERGTHGTGPMSPRDEAVAWIDRFNEFAAAACERWTMDINTAYAYCFDVDLLKLGVMECGNKLDVRVSIQSHEFNAQHVEATFRFLNRLKPPKTQPMPSARESLREKLKSNIKHKRRGRQRD